MTNLVDGYPHEIGSRAAFKGKSVVFIKVKSTILRVIRMRQGRRAKWILASLLLAGPLVTPPPKAKKKKISIRLEMFLNVLNVIHHNTNYI